MPKKVLIADQSETVRAVAENLFRKEGIEVVSASDGVEALDLIKTGGIDLALLNSSLPEIDGYSVSEQTKRNGKTKGVKVVLLLSTSEMVDQHRLMSSLADDTLNKPFTPQDLIEISAAAMGVEMETTTEADTESSDDDRIAEDVEELGFDSSPKEEIDFDSIFGDGKEDEEEPEAGGVFLSGESDDEPADGGGASELVGEPADVKEGRNDMTTRSINETEEKIRLADDQYDLESQRSSVVPEPPHDYNWFIREMKKDLTKSEEGKFSAPAKKSKGDPAGDRAKAESGTQTQAQGHFAVEEINKSRTPVGVGEPEENIGVELRAEIQMPSENDSRADYLSLAEKLLIKELAAKIAESLVKRISGTELRQIVTEALSNLKKI